MDDTDKTQGQGGQVQDLQQPPIQNLPSQGGGVGALVKEREVAQPSQVRSPEFIEPSGSESEPKIHQELQEMGVRSVSQTPKLDNYAQKAGISHAGESIPVSQQTSGISQLVKQLEDEGANKQGTDKSIHWLWKEVRKVFKRE